MSKKKFTGSVNGKGYYIALVLCAVAIGIAGFLYYRNTDKPNKTADGNTIVNPDDTPVVATNPDGTPATIPNQAEKKPLKTVSPLEGQTVAVYAMDSLTYNATTRDWRVHNGIDIAAQTGTEVRAAADGEVYTVYEDEQMGHTVVIRHENGYATKYSSLAETIAVKPGDTVTAGQAIGTVGESALCELADEPHLHFEMTVNGTPTDPMTLLSEESREACLREQDPGYEG
jgi:murein DD-endopeptidase MepM/ murein hydrolase activator NlpD